MYEQTGQADVKHQASVLLRAALVAEQVPDLCSGLGVVGLLKAILVSHEVQQLGSQFTALNETLGDVHGVGDAVFLVLETHLVQLTFDVPSRNVLGHRLCAEVFCKGTPQGTPTTAS